MWVHTVSPTISNHEKFVTVCASPALPETEEAQEETTMF